MSIDKRSCALLIPYLQNFKQITFNNLPDEVKKDAILVVQEQEKDEYNYISEKEKILII